MINESENNNTNDHTIISIERQIKNLKKLVFNEVLKINIIKNKEYQIELLDIVNNICILVFKHEHIEFVKTNNIITYIYLILQDINDIKTHSV